MKYQKKVMTIDIYHDLRARESRILKEILTNTDVVLATNSGAADHNLKYVSKC